MPRVTLILMSIVLTLAGCQSKPAPVPPHVYLVLTDDPATSITVQFHTQDAVASTVDYAALGADGQPGETLHAAGTSLQVPGLADGRHVHAVPLSGLRPGTQYQFTTSSGATGKFTTLEGGEAPLRVLFAGDMGTDESSVNFMKRAAALDPDIAMLGGDLAYDDGKLRKVGVWDAWMNHWRQHMVRSDGSMVPLIAAVGNHEINGEDSSDPLVKAPFYAGFFAQGGSAHFVRDISPLARIVVLDSDYFTSEQEQAPFLDKALDNGDHAEYLIANYHVALFPTHNDFDQDHPTAGRNHWLPLFDRHDVTVAFEHHDHAFKRTHPITGGAVDPEGVVYLGDGCMGQEARSVKEPDAWYFAKAEPRAHFWIADITDDAMICKAVDEQGVVFDTVEFEPRESADEAPVLPGTPASAS
ncbi:MAG: hypothetical protein RLZZ303_583 [Candidatus Hydrogenedentota bacterium]|jgi:hypothetical protein